MPSVPKAPSIARGRGPRRRRRAAEITEPTVDPFRARHLALGRRQVATDHGAAAVTVDEQESPLAWLARRRGRDGCALIAPHQLQAGERLRTDFTVADLMPHVTTNWDNPLASGGAAPSTANDTMTDARGRVHAALESVGPEFAGLLLDVCCFLKGLEDIERERRWPPRSGKVVLQLALDRLARHYGYATQIRGPAHAAIRTWLADGAAFSANGHNQAGASAALASARMRSIIERRPFDRCGVRPSRRPIRSNSSSASMSRISRAVLPE